MLYKVLKDGNVPAMLEISETFSHSIGKWLFLSPIFAKTVKPIVILPFSIVILLFGAFGSAYASLDPALFFYFPYSGYEFSSIMALYIFSWISLFLFAEAFTYILYRRVGNDLQLFTCIGIASIPLAVYPYIYYAFSTVFWSHNLDIIMQYVLIILQIFTLLLVSAAFCFGKGIRLDKAIVISLTALYLNIAILFVLGRFT